MKAEQINTRIDASTKKAAEAVFQAMGLKPAEAVRMFYHQVILEQGLPFRPHIPNLVTQEALQEPRDALESFESFAALRQSLDI